jgi:TetR/AcrR family transcriptional regulator
MSKVADAEEKILEAAKIVFMKYGLYGARMQDIADTAGINKALLHYYFRSKEKLFDKIFESALARYFESMQVWNDDTLTLKQKLFKFIDTIIDFYAEYPQMSVFIIKEISNSPEVFREKVLAIKKNKGYRHLIILLQEEIQHKRIKKIDPALFVVNLHSLCAYPFIAMPIFKQMYKAAHCSFDKDFNKEQLKESAKEFVVFKLGLK